MGFITGKYLFNEDTICCKIAAIPRVLIRYFETEGFKKLLVAGLNYFLSLRQFRFSGLDSLYREFACLLTGKRV
jgi:hypothetical protein